MHNKQHLLLEIYCRIRWICIFASYGDSAVNGLNLETQLLGDYTVLTYFTKSLFISKFILLKELLPKILN